MKLADAPYGSAIVGQWEMFRGAVSSFVFPLDYRANSYNINLFWDGGSDRDAYACADRTQNTSSKIRDINISHFFDNFR